MPIKRKKNRQQLLKIVFQQIVFSLGLEQQKKEDLIRILPSLSEEKLLRLNVLLNEEKFYTQTIFMEFFEKHPELFSQYQRLYQERINALYQTGEQYEQEQKERRLLELMHIYY